MTDKKNQPKISTELRRRVEEKLRQEGPQDPESLSGLSHEVISQTKHELRVHQIELEMQTEELRQAQIALDELLDGYFDLYDRAPVSYITLSEKGLILKTNLTAANLLCKDRGELIKKPISRFILNEDQNIYYLTLTRLIKTGEPQNCELRIVRPEDPPFWARLDITAARDKDGSFVCRMVIIDITDRKQTEEALSFLLTCGSPFTGEDFFLSLARYLSQTLDMEYVCIDSLGGDSLTAQTVAIYNRGQFETNVSYTLKDTPCGEVVNTDFCCYLKGVRSLFPKDVALQELMAESYFGTTLIDSKGQQIGLIAVIGQHSMNDPKRAESLLKVVAPRATGELERRRAEENTRREATVNEALVDIARALALPEVSVPGISVVVNEHALRLTGSAHGYVASINPQTGALVPHTLPSIMGQGSCQVKDNPAIAFLRGEKNSPGLCGYSLESLFSNDPASHPLLTGLPEGRIHLKRFLLVPAVYKGQLYGQIALVNSDRDYTQEDIKVVDALAYLLAMTIVRKHEEDDLIEALESAQRANHAKSIFLSSMSHELRTPLNSILGFGQLLEMDKTLNSTQANYVRKILSGGRLLLTLVSDVLDLALIESGKTELLLESVDCSEVMNECLDLVQSIAEDRGTCLDLRSFDPLMRVLADRNRMKQILINLLSNAVKYNSREGTVRIAAVNHEKGVRIMVTDTGPGIPADKLGELFIPFNRLGKETGTIPGSGIGLALSKRLAKQMKGDIGLESTGDKGSCFWVELPLIEGYETLSEQKDDEHQNTPVGKLITGVKALVVDDVEMNRELLGEFLSLFNSNVFFAASGEEALEVVSKEEFDIIFMDVKMPGMDGIETTRRIREMSLQHIPIIAVTALAMKGDQDKFLKLGMDDYISKPIKIEQVQNILEKYTGSKTGHP